MPATDELSGRLLGVADRAIVQSAALGSVGEGLAAAWRERRAEFLRGVVVSPETARWLSLEVDYWGPKDRAYAAYLSRLLETFRPHGSGGGQ